jgi:chromosome segregation ATPase
MLPPNTRDGNLQPPFADLDFDAINGQLLSVCKAIEATRMKARSSVAAADQERILRLRCSDAYKRLYTRYEQTAQELHDTSSKYVSLQQQLDAANEAISTYVSNTEDYEQRLANSVQMADYEATRATQLESTVKKFEEEKHDIKQKLQEYQVALKYAANQLIAEKQKIGLLEKEKEVMVQDHQIQAATAACRISEREQKSISVDHIRSSTAGKRQSDETSHKDGPATRGRKRKAVMQNGGDSDTAQL